MTITIPIDASPVKPADAPTPAKGKDDFIFDTRLNVTLNVEDIIEVNLGKSSNDTIIGNTHYSSVHTIEFPYIAVSQSGNNPDARLRVSFIVAMQVNELFKMIRPEKTNG